MVDLPTGRISGAALRALSTSLRKTPLKHVATRVLRNELGIDGLGQQRQKAVAYEGS